MIGQRIPQSTGSGTVLCSVPVTVCRRFSWRLADSHGAHEQNGRSIGVQRPGLAEHQPGGGGDRLLQVNSGVDAEVRNLGQLFHQAFDVLFVGGHHGYCTVVSSIEFKSISGSTGGAASCA